MLFQTRVNWCAKDLASQREYEDAFFEDADWGRLAVSDGVASGVFSRSWAQLLSEAAVRTPPDPNDSEAVKAWLKKPRDKWFGQIDFNTLPWNVKGKFQQAGGGYATLLWVELSPAQDDQLGYLYYTV